MSIGYFKLIQSICSVHMYWSMPLSKLNTPKSLFFISFHFEMKWSDFVFSFYFVYFPHFSMISIGGFAMFSMIIIGAPWKNWNIISTTWISIEWQKLFRYFCEAIINFYSMSLFWLRIVGEFHSRLDYPNGIDRNIIFLFIKLNKIIKPYPQFTQTTKR